MNSLGIQNLICNVNIWRPNFFRAYNNFLTYQGSKKRPGFLCKCCGHISNPCPNLGLIYLNRLSYHVVLTTKSISVTSSPSSTEEIIREKVVSDIFKLWEIVLDVSYSVNIWDGKIATLCELHQFDWKHTAVYTQKLKVKSDRQCRATICDDTVLVHGKLFIPIWLNASFFKILKQRNTSYTINGCKFSDIGDIRKFAGCFEMKSTRKMFNQALVPSFKNEP